jgi:myosin heavy subunit
LQLDIKKTEKMEKEERGLVVVEDMILLSELTVDSLLWNLRSRYACKEIYTYTGSILVSVNPYERLPIYDLSIAKQYIGQRIGALPPHIFAIADQAYRSVLETGESQSVIISGESGAGKVCFFHPKHFYFFNGFRCSLCEPFVLWF